MRIVELASGERLGEDVLGRPRASRLDELSTAMRAVEEVRERGVATLLERARRLALEPSLESPFVPQRAQDEAFDQVNDASLEEIYSAYQDIRDYHERAPRQGWFTVRPDGAMLGEVVSAVHAAGVCLQGIHATSPVDLLSCVLPARLAGVERVVLAVPPRAELMARGGFGVAPQVLAAAHLAGVDQIVLADGANAVAALALGADGMEPVDRVVGFGDAAALAAGQLLAGAADVSLAGGAPAGCILSDGSGSAADDVADLAAWAEGDLEARRFLVGWNASVVGRAASGTEITAVLAADRDTAIAAVNDIAPAWLALRCTEAMPLLGRIRVAGTVCVGRSVSAARSERLMGSIAAPTVADFQRSARIAAFK